jgi:hypothetical protein
MQGIGFLSDVPYRGYAGGWQSGEGSLHRHGDSAKIYVEELAKLCWSSKLEL